MEARTEAERERFGGLNPNFAKKVWASRRAAEDEERKRAYRARAERIHAHQERNREIIRKQRAEEEKARQRGDLVRAAPGKIPPRSIIAIVAARHGLEVEAIMNGNNTKPAVECRHEAVAAVHAEYPDMSLKRLGMVFKRHHTTILHALRKKGAWGNPMQESRMRQRPQDGIRCTNCGSVKLRVRDTIKEGGKVRRRRSCMVCEHKFETHEVVADTTTRAGD